MMRRRPLPALKCVIPARRGGESLHAPVMSLDVAEVPGGVMLRCEGALCEATSLGLLRVIGRLLALPVPYLCIDLRDLDSADKALIHVLEAASAVAVMEGTKLEMIPGPAALAVIQPPPNEEH